MMGTGLFDYRSSVFASGGMVAAGSPLATQAGLRVLADGGNAVGAEVASTTSPRRTRDSWRIGTRS